MYQLLLIFTISVSEFSHRKAICLHCYRKTNVTYPVLRAKLLNLSKVRRSYFISWVYSTVMECFGKGVFPCLSFDLKLTSQNLVSPVYSSYQPSLYDKITSLREKGMNYVEIAHWLNKYGYNTPRGNTFGNNHVHSIVKKRRSRLEFRQKEPTQSLSNVRLRYKKIKWINFYRKKLL